MHFSVSMVYMMTNVINPMAAYVKREWRDSPIQCAVQGKNIQEGKTEICLFPIMIWDYLTTAYSTHRSQLAVQAE